MCNRIRWQATGWKKMTHFVRIIQGKGIIGWIQMKQHDGILK